MANSSEIMSQIMPGDPATEPRARWWTTEQCVVCAAFPGHSGVHYIVREVATFLCSGWVRMLGEPRWVPLRGAFTAPGNQILISAHQPEDLDVRQVDGLWFREQQGPAVVAANEWSAEQPAPPPPC